MKKIVIAGKKIKGLNGEDLVGPGAKSIMLGESIGGLLSSEVGRGKDAAKLFSIATRFYNGKNFELDGEDVKLVASVVRSSKTYSVLAIAQMLEILDQAKDTSKK